MKDNPDSPRESLSTCLRHLEKAEAGVLTARATAQVLATCMNPTGRVWSKETRDMKTDIVTRLESLIVRMRQDVLIYRANCEGSHD